MVPLASEGQPFGVVSVQSKRVAAFTQSDEQLWSAIAGQLSQAIEVARLHDSLKRMATIDGLTGVANHRHFYERLEAELARAERDDQPLGLLLIDVDSLKSINDAHGHLAGDTLLRGVAAALTRTTRLSDIVARYGGDEFAVILPGAGEEEAARCLGRVLEALEAEPIEYAGRALTASVSVGTAVYPRDGTRAKALILAADQRLYAGRRRRATAGVGRGA